MNRLLPALITYGLIGLAFAFDSRADECEDFAYLVEALNRAEQHQRPGISAAWKRMTGDRDKIELITKAYAFVAAGGSEGEAWKQCESY